MSAEQIVDAAIALTVLPARGVSLDDYARDLDDAPPVQAAKDVAVRMARVGDEEACYLALYEAARLTIGF